VVDEGAYLTPLPSNAVIHMYVYGGRLYVGTDKPAEMIRINPDDTWDLIVGTPREAPDGWKEPLSGMGPGFDYWLNEHIWRMCEHEGRMYVGTNDATGFGKEYRFMRPFLDTMGYDFYVTSNGADYNMLTRTGFADEGFGDQLGIGIRVLASTPYGLFFGTSNPFYGLRIYQGEVRYRLYLPLVQALTSSLAGRASRDSGGPSGARIFGQAEHSLRGLGAPARVGSENRDDAVILSWEPVPRAVRYRVLRSTFVPARELGISTDEPEARIPQPFREIGIADRPFFVDVTTQADRVYHYYVLAESSDGVLSSPSNLARSPSLNTPVTMSGLRRAVANWTAQNQAEAHGERGGIADQLSSAQRQLDADDLQGATVGLERLRIQARLKRLEQLSWWRMEDLDLMLGKLIQRIRLAQAGAISALALR